MPSHIPLVEDGHLIGLDGKPLAPLPVNAWSGLPFEIHPHIRKGEVARRYNPHPLLLVHQRAHGRSRIRSGQTVFDLDLAPGQIDVFSSGFHMDHGWWDCTPGEVLAVELDPEHVRSFWSDAAGVDPQTRLGVRDPVLEQLIACVRAEVESGCRSGRLFAESLSMSLLARVAACYTQRLRPLRAASRLASQQVSLMVEFIDANLASDLGIGALAGQLSMSVSTFGRRFKATLDMTPHNFVLSRRIRRAEALLESDVSLSEIALAVGFASQSHFTEAFRRRTGRTPLQARRRA
jgi:AraC family transcriptional regulator